MSLFSPASLHALWLILGMALVTFLLRALPFLAERVLRRWHWIERLGRFLPAAIMMLLLAHTLRQTSAERMDSALPAATGGVLWPGYSIEITATLLVLLLHAWRRNTLLSIGVGTALYVLLRALPAFAA